MDDKHWTQDLFPATYHLSKDEVKNPLAGKNASADHSPRTRIEAIYRKVKSEFDEEVWNARQKSTQVGDSLLEYSGLNESHHGETQTDSKREKNSRSPQTTDEERETENFSLWDSKEIDILRNVFLKTKHENNNLKVELDIVRNEIENITEKLKEKEKDSKMKEDMAKGTQNAFESLYLENNHLQREIKLMKQRCKSLEEDVQDLSKDKAKLKSEKREERRKYLEELARRRNVEDTLKKLELKTKTSERAAIETLKISYKKEIRRLLDEVNEKSDRLEREIEDHKHTKTALDHMRYHFASLPHEPVRIASMREEDILKNLQI